jgi:hypothetical protein
MNYLDRHCVDDLFRSKREARRVAGLPDSGKETESYVCPLAFDRKI